MGFLKALFVDIFGYTLNPNPNYDLSTEYKNIKDAKKANGTTIINGSVFTVIEPKDTKITDLFYRLNDNEIEIVEVELRSPQQDM